MTMIIQERPDHGPAIDHLLDLAFGPGRFAKTAYRLREGVAPIAALGMVALDEDGALVGTLRYWPILIDGAHPAILLGPLAVDPARRSAGTGLALMRASLDRAVEWGHRICVLVGDEPYYAKVGFSRDLARGLSLPGPVDPRRLLAKELAPGAMTGVAGLVGRARVPDAGSAALAPPAEEQAAE